MARLTAFFICSLDLRLTDDAGRFDWAFPPPALHAFANEHERTIGTHLYGRRMWETMRFWQTAPEEDSVEGEYGAIWREADKVVYSRTLESVDEPRTRLEREFDVDGVRALKARAAKDLSVSGAELAAHALRAGLVDELSLLLVPVVVGEGPRVIPDGLARRLELREHRALDAGWCFLRYAVGSAL